MFSEEIASGFECPASALRQFDLVFGAGFLAVLFERQFDQFVDQIPKRDAASLPHLWIHTDRRKAGDGVHFVQENLAAFFFQKEIDAGQAAQFQGAECGYGELLDLFQLCRFQLRRNQQLRAFF